MPLFINLGFFRKTIRDDIILFSTEKQYIAMHWKPEQTPGEQHPAIQDDAGGCPDVAPFGS